MAAWQRATKKDWIQAWDSLSAGDQKQALDAFLGDLRGDEEHSDSYETLIEEIAEAAHFRKQMLRRWPTGKLRQILHPYVTNVLTPWMWGHLFRVFYFQTRSAMMNDFLDALGISHDGSGGITADSFSPDTEQ